MRALHTRLVPGLLATCALSGCAGTLSKTAETAAPVITDEMVEGIYEDRALIGKILSDPEVVRGAGELGAATTRGMLDELKTEARTIDLGRLAQDFELKLNAEFGPELVPLVAESLDRSLEGALDDETRGRAQAFALSISEATAQGFVRGFGDELARRVGDDTPSLEVAKLARAASRGAALGLQDAVQETEARRRAGNGEPGDVLGVASEAADAGVRLLRVLPLLLAALAMVVSGAAIWMLFSLHRDLRRLLEQRSEPPQRPDSGGGHAYAGE